ncbi:MAG: ABC transporter substrate-binding protein [Alphaproteobacteria bacterium]|nr:MAG: ABC transporter substrate-binding protein [Alphaproteobacteria bacterium]
MRLTRRSLVRSGVLAALCPIFDRLPFLGAAARAQAGNGEGSLEWRHGLSLFGDLKYPAAFKHFDYVNPNAPKGGSVRLMAIGTFDNFNEVVAGLKGSIAAGAGMISDTLLAPALDEVSTEYGLIAEAVSHPRDFSSATFRLRAAARHHDGKPVTVDDVIFSMQAFKTHNPSLAAYYRHVAKVEQTGEREVTFIFDAPGNRELPQIVGQLNVLPKHWWQGTDASGRKRDVGATTLEPPLGNGAYRIKEFVAGRTVVYERVKDYWAKDLNVNAGRDNFDEMRFEYFRDATVGLEAFKADHLDWRTENIAKNWATAYDFPAVNEKRVLLEEFPQRNRGIMQAFAFNTRRDKFKNPQLRRAFKTVKDKVPPELFTTEYTNPVGGTPEKVRANLREAMRLLKEAGYEIRNQKLVNAKSGEPFSFEILTEEPSVERIILFYKPSLERLGMAVNVRTVDDPQYENRLRSWDFDMIVASWPESLSPGNEQRDYWGSQAADTVGSRNYVGIKNPAVDALIDRVIFAKDRAELVAATKALDRVLLWNYYVVPQFTSDKIRSARWDRFNRQDPLPKYGASAFPTVWWWDAEKAAKIGTRS